MDRRGRAQRFEIIGCTNLPSALDLRPLESEKVALSHLLGRVLADDVLAPVDVPGFDRSNVDGYAIRAEDVYGCSEEEPACLAIIAEATTVRTSRRVEQLFLITLARKPTPAESARLVKYVEKGGPSGDPREALCDVFWALLNSSEFSVNH